MKKKDLNLNQLVKTPQKVKGQERTYTDVLSATKVSKVGRPKSDDPRIAFGVGLRASEVERIKSLAHKNNVSANALTAFLVRHGLKLIEAGELELPIQTTLNRINES